MQTAIQQLVDLGQLPRSSAATVPVVQAFEQQLSKVQAPISDDEARALVKLFGPDDCFGLAWTLLHLIESAPGWPLKDVLDSSAGEWVECLRERAS